MCPLFRFLFQAKKIVNPDSISKDFTLWDYVDVNMSSQAGIKGCGEVNAFKDLFFIKNAFIWGQNYSLGN